MRSMRGAGVRTTAVAAAAVLALSACGSDSDEESAETSESTSQSDAEIELASQGSDSDEESESTGPSLLENVTVEAGEDSDIVRLTFADGAREPLGDYFVNPIYRGGDRTDETHDGVEGHWYLKLHIPGQDGTGDEDVYEDITFDGDRVVHYYPVLQFEGMLEAVIGINSENGLMPEYEITTEGSDLVIEITDGEHDS